MGENKIQYCPWCESQMIFVERNRFSPFKKDFYACPTCELQLSLRDLKNPFLLSLIRARILFYKRELENLQKTGEVGDLGKHDLTLCYEFGIVRRFILDKNSMKQGRRLAPFTQEILELIESGKDEQFFTEKNKDWVSKVQELELF